MPAASNIRDYLLPHLGLSNVNLLPANASARMLSAVNRALQEIFPETQQAARRFQVQPPTSVTLGAVTANSTAITFAGFQSWMLGCTIVISGDPQQNRLVKDASASVALLGPYQGSSGSAVTATVFGDCLTFTTELSAIYPPVKLDGQYFLEPVNGPRGLDDLRNFGTLEGQAATSIKDRRRPQFYSLQDALAYNTTPSTMMVLDSLPDVGYLLELQATLRAPRIADWNDTRDYFMPNQRDEAILWPWARYHFRDWPQFIPGAAGMDAIIESYREASTLWRARTQGYVHTQIDISTYG